jgi:UDP-N-acetylglucosamine 4,6-dehydratase
MPMNTLDDASILVTGGTGSFGHKFLDMMLRDHTPRKLIVFSRDELKQHDMRVAGYDQPILRYFIGDVRDRDRLRETSSKPPWTAASKR